MTITIITIIAVVIVIGIYAMVKTRFQFTSSLVTILNADEKKRVTLEFKKITGIEYNPMEGEEDNGDRFYYSYYIFYADAEGTLKKIKFNLYDYDTKNWNHFKERLLINNPAVSIHEHD